MTEASSSTSIFRGKLEEEPQSAKAQQKKKGSLPGTPNPDVEVIALSPKTLLETYRFICEVCHKGFQREQNLQLHRRGHNLPWKLNEESNKEVNRKVYICPEPSCAHHDPSSALGDLTGIKKHYSRKHREKKYKCKKCSKKYAVQSDWKAHSKTCGIREYRCDCGTLFSRPESFITHRAFCDVLAQESARHSSAHGIIPSHVIGSHLSNPKNLDLSQVGSKISITDILTLGSGNLEQSMLPQTQTPLIFPQPHAKRMSTSSPFYLSNTNQRFNQLFDYDQESHQPVLMENKTSIHGLRQLPDLHSNPTKTSPNLLNLGFFSGSSNPIHGLKNSQSDSQNNNTIISSSSFMIPDDDHVFLNNNNPHHESPTPPQLSAIALLQKAARMGSTTSNNTTTTLLKSFGSSFTSSVAGDDRGDQMIMRSEIESDNLLQQLMNMNIGDVNEAGRINPKNFSLSIGSSNRATLDFLGVGYTQREQQQQQQSSRIEISSLDPKMDSLTQATHVLGGSSNMQGK